ncbi:MAG: GntR family transcriptional regulator [Syntrophomonadaceae bacterium]|nr:GntR family transcriptional regulator [Syntrophomonadaceae bacterium]
MPCLQFNTSQPIYKQIINDYKKLLIRKELKKGDKIMSQREYAEMVSVNPNTVQRAYREMENMNLVETLRGQGTFISVSDEQLEEIKTEMAGDLINHFIGEMQSLGFGNKDIINIVQKQLSDREGGSF